MFLVLYPERGEDVAFQPNEVRQNAFIISQNYIVLRISPVKDEDELMNLFVPRLGRETRHSTATVKQQAYRL